MGIIKILKTLNLFKSFYFSWKTFSFREAFKLPVLIGRNSIINNWGKIEVKVPPYSGMISIGCRKLNGYENYLEPLMFSNYGKIIIGGPMKIYPGAKIVCSSGGVINFGGRNTIGRNTKIICYKHIVIGYNSGCSWECQIFDTDFHYLIDLDSGRPYKRTKPVSIGDNVFIGNHCNIGKGTKIPKGCVVSSWSKVSGSFENNGENLLLLGNPATVVRTGVSMSYAWDTE